MSFKNPGLYKGGGYTQNILKYDFMIIVDQNIYPVRHLFAFLVGFGGTRLLGACVVDMRGARAQSDDLPSTMQWPEKSKMENKPHASYFS